MAGMVLVLSLVVAEQNCSLEDGANYHCSIFLPKLNAPIKTLGAPSKFFDYLAAGCPVCSVLWGE